VNIPVIASGGAGTMKHFAEVFTQQRPVLHWQQAFSILAKYLFLN
jgi:imidazole glycerol phosphate synthase subunit HisF